MAKSPAFQFYASDFLGSRRVRMMTLEDRGAYITLLADSWAEDGLPADLSEVAALLNLNENSSKFKRIWERIGPAFDRDGDKLRNARQELERSKQAENRAKKVQAAESRWHPQSTRNANAYADASGVQCPPIPIPSPLHTTTTAGEVPAGALPGSPAVPKQKKGGLSADGQRVWDFYQALHPRARVDDKLAGRIRKALDSYSADDLCHAIQGCHEDDWHATKGKTDLAYILRDSNNVALFLAKYDANNAPLVGTDGNLTPAGQRYFAGAKS